jgi:hypothetical protein
MLNIAQDRLGYQQITNVSAAVGLTIPVGTAFALIQAESQNVRWRDDGTDPTATVGMVLMAGSTLEYDGSSFASIKFIEVAASAKLNISYYGTETV